MFARFFNAMGRQLRALWPFHKDPLPFPEVDTIIRNDEVLSGKIIDFIAGKWEQEGYTPIPQEARQDLDSLRQYFDRIEQHSTIQSEQYGNDQLIAHDELMRALDPILFRTKIARIIGEIAVYHHKRGVQPGRESVEAALNALLETPEEHSVALRGQSPKP